jgi:hypothetical protein
MPRKPGSNKVKDLAQKWNPNFLEVRKRERKRKETGWFSRISGSHLRQKTCPKIN